MVTTLQVAYGLISEVFLTGSDPGWIVHNDQNKINVDISTIGSLKTIKKKISNAYLLKKIFSNVFRYIL